MRSLRHLVIWGLLVGTAFNLISADRDADTSQTQKKDPLAAKIDSYYKFGFPKAGRSLKQKIKEADDFLTKDFPTYTTVGVSASIVYNDQVVLSKGFGLRQSNDPKSHVTVDSLFQIGSVSKTMIAVAVGMLVDGGQVKWTDTVKMHLPWLTLFDKYAEEHVTIGNLLSMNSGFGRSQDLPMFTGVYGNEKKLVQAMAFSQPESSLRETPAYANTNYEILGQLIEVVSGSPWHVFLQERVWVPLGMKNTFASAQLVPKNLQKTTLNQGHEVCLGQVAGPYDLATSITTDLTAGSEGGLIAAGSVVSSAADMATFARFLLNKGKVGNVVLLNQTSIISDMTSGKNGIALAEVQALFDYIGFHYIPEGDSLSAGYGFDFVGDLMWGRPYYDKGGDTYVHHADTGFAPREALGVVFLSNSQGTSVFTMQARAYVMGIFLDIPKEILDYQLKKQRGSLPPPDPPFPGAPTCGFSFWKNPPHNALEDSVSKALVGTYAPLVSPQYMPAITVAHAANSTTDFIVQAGHVNATFFAVGILNNTYVFMTENAPLGLPAFVGERDADAAGAFTLTFIGIPYRKQTTAVV